MSEDLELLELNRISKIIVDSSFKVHKAIGPGLLESVYEARLFYELTRRGLTVRRQVDLPIRYDELLLESGLRIDLLVEEKIIPLFDAQLLSHLKLADKRLGFLINFNTVLIKDGIKRMMN